MNVAELIEHLKTLPQGHLVVYQACSDMNTLQKEEISVTKVCLKCRKWTNMKDTICPYCHLAWLATQEKVPEFVDVVMFPGN